MTLTDISDRCRRNLDEQCDEIADDGGIVDHSPHPTQGLCSIEARPGGVEVAHIRPDDPGGATNDCHPLHHLGGAAVVNTVVHDNGVPALAARTAMAALTSRLAPVTAGTCHDGDTLGFATLGRRRPPDYLVSLKWMAACRAPPTIPALLASWAGMISVRNFSCGR